MDARTSLGPLPPHSEGTEIAIPDGAVGGPDFRAVFDAMPGVSLLLATDAPHFTMLAASDERLAATLTTREETLGRPLFEVFSDANPENGRPTGESNLRTSLETVLRTHAPHRMAVQRYDIRRPDGTWEVRHWAPRNVPVLGSDGAVRYIVHHVEDVTEAVQRAEAHEQLRGEYTESEEARHELESANELLREQQLELEMANQQLQDQSVELELQADDLRLGAAALEERTVEAEHSLAEAEAARARTDAVLACIGDAFYLLDREWRFTHVNASAEPLLQSTEAALVGRTLWEAFPGVVGSVFEGPYRDAMATGRQTAVEAYFEPLGAWFDVRSYPWENGLMVHFRDVSARRAAEAERERLLTAAEASNRAKGEFLAVMSHELRTPLNAIGGYAELIELGIRGPVTGLQREDLARIQRSQRHLLGLVNEVLNYAKLEAGTVRFDVARVVVADALAEAEALVSPQARAKGLVLAASDCPDDLVARADPEKLRQVLVNLLGNAVKFTDPRGGEPGRISVSCAADGERIRIVVADTGIGIAAEKLDVVFEPFVQVRADLTRTADGTGLGLAISRDLARGMGGELRVESTLGVGSTFLLLLPRA